LPTIKVPDIGKASVLDDSSGGPQTEFNYEEYEVTEEQAAHWSRLNEKERLTMVLNADREHKDVREYL
jgi:hypothetical protein